MGRGEMIEAVLASQAELQTALGLYRLQRDEHGYDRGVEARMQASLALQHALLRRLGRPMMTEATLPEGWHPA